MSGSSMVPEMFRAREMFERARRNADTDLHSARHMPGTVYTSDEVLALEREQIFMRSWLCVGREEELAEPGAYYASRILEEPFLVVRGENGEINAFSNSCRHRGVEVARIGRGTAKRFSCPYHAWTYDLNGKLLGAPLMRESKADLSNCKLPSLRVDTWQGWIFINFDPEAESLSAALAEFSEEFGFMRHDQCRLAHLFSTELGCNWKFVVENLMDVYHVGTVHGTSFGARYRQNPEDYTFRLWRNGGFSFYFDAAPLTPEGKSLVGPMPSLADRGTQFACLGFIAPNINFAARCDSLRFWVSWPLSPGRTQLLAYTLFAKEATEAPGFADKLDTYMTFMAEFVDEDREMMESLQSGSAAKRFEPGPMAKLEEPIHHLVRSYLHQMAPAR